MARGSYLEQIASRAVPDTRFLRPRRPVLAPFPVPPDQAVPAAQVAFAVAPAATPGAPSPLGAATPLDPLSPPPAHPSLRPEPAPVVAATSTSPVGESAVVSPHDPSPATDPSRRTAPPATLGEGAPAKPSVAVTPPSPEQVAKTPAATRGRIAPPRHVPAAPDPLALALATAVRWTSSDEMPDAIARRPQPELPPTKPAGRDRSPAGPARETAPLRAASRLEPSSPPVSPTTRPPSPEVPAGPQERATRALAVEGAAPEAAGIHIGSVEVQILAPPPVAPPVPRPTAAARAAPPGPLARGLASAIGLRQS